MALAHKRNQTVIEKPGKLEIVQPYIKHGHTNKPKSNPFQCVTNGRGVERLLVCLEHVCCVHVPLHAPVQFVALDLPVGLLGRVPGDLGDEGVSLDEIGNQVTGLRRN